MAMPTIMGVADAIRTKWGDDTTLNGLIDSSKVYFDRAAEGTAFPYAVLKIDSAQSERLTDGLYLTRYSVNVESYITSSGSVVNDIQSAIMNTLTGGPSDPAAGLSVTDGNVIGSKLVPSATRCNVTGERVDSNDVVKLSVRIEILVSGVIP